MSRALSACQRGLAVVTADNFVITAAVLSECFMYWTINASELPSVTGGSKTLSCMTVALRSDVGKRMFGCRSQKSRVWMSAVSLLLCSRGFESTTFANWISLCRCNLVSRLVAVDIHDSRHEYARCVNCGSWRRQGLREARVESQILASRL